MPPKGQGIKKQILYIYDKDENKYVAWDGVLKDKFSVGDGPGISVYEGNSHLLGEILAELRIMNEYLLCVVGEDNKLEESDVEVYTGGLADAI